MSKFIITIIAINIIGFLILGPFTPFVTYGPIQQGTVIGFSTDGRISLIIGYQCQLNGTLTIHQMLGRFSPSSEYNTGGQIDFREKHSPIGLPMGNEVINYSYPSTILPPSCKMSTSTVREA